MKRASAAGSRRPRATGIAMKQLIYIVAAGSLLTAVSVTIQLRAYYRGEVAEVEQVLEAIETTYLPALSRSIFNFDTSQTALLVEGLELMRSIDYAEVREPRGGDLEITASAGAMTSENGIDRTFPIRYEYEGMTRDLGDLYVYSSIDRIREMVTNQSVVVIASNAAQVFAVALLIFLILQVSVVRHLRRIARYVRRIDFRGPSVPQLVLTRSARPSHRDDEIDEIVRAINETNSRLTAMFAELSSARDRLSGTVAEKETLLRELYHRTKNNMQVIISMLAMQGARMPENEAIQTFVTDSRNRIQAMALVHEKLYQSHDLSRIAMSEYLTDLASLTIASYSDHAASPRLTVRVDESAFLLDTAIPCGLIVNELVSNSVKHAFPNRPPGEIVVELSSDDTGRARLDVSDDGVGMPADYDFRAQGGMGLQTVYSLAEHQLNGTVRLGGSRGTQCVIDFVTTLYFERV